jgi:hypothetical protein
MYKIATRKRKPTTAVVRTTKRDPGCSRTVPSADDKGRSPSGVGERVSDAALVPLTFNEMRR